MRDEAGDPRLRATRVTRTRIGPALPATARAWRQHRPIGWRRFAILLPGATNHEALGMARDVLQALDHPFVVEEQRFDIGVSIGIVVYPEHGGDGETLLRHADAAMYAAKERRIGFAV
jgi:diguanylate cyclase (GGDEF)-like protein